MKSVSGDYSLSLDQNLVIGISEIKPQTSYSTLKGFIVKLIETHEIIIT